MLSKGDTQRVSPFFFFKKQTDGAITIFLLSYNCNFPQTFEKARAERTVLGKLRNACGVSLKMGSRKVYNYSTKLDFAIF
jgi:hypothetical protein